MNKSTRYVQVDNVIVSRPQPITQAAHNVSTSDVMCGMDTGGWPEQETQWWSPPLRGFVAAFNSFTPYNAATDVLRAKQSKWFDEYQTQIQPQRFYFGVQAFPVYAFASDMARAKRSTWSDEYQPQPQIQRFYAPATNGSAGGFVAPTYNPGPRYIILQPPRPFTISALTMQQFNVKDPAESVLLTFNMAPDLATGETLVGAPSVNITVVQGTDASPAGMLTGVAGFDSTKTQVVVPVSGGLSNVFYEVQVTCSTSNFQKKLTLAGILPVRSII